MRDALPLVSDCAVIPAAFSDHGSVTFIIKIELENKIKVCILEADEH